MSRSGYSDDIDNWSMIKWRGRIASATRGKRGQALLRDLLAALDAMPEKRLISGELEIEGEFCALGVVGSKRGVALASLDPEDPDAVGAAFDIAPCLAQEIVYENDEVIDDWKRCQMEICGPVRPRHPEYGRHTVQWSEADPQAPERRWLHMRNWVASQIAATEPPAALRED